MKVLLGVIVVLISQIQLGTAALNEDCECNELDESECSISAQSGQACVWEGSTCVNKKCSLIPPTNYCLESHYCVYEKQTNQCIDEKPKCTDYQYSTPEECLLVGCFHAKGDLTCVGFPGCSSLTQYLCGLVSNECYYSLTLSECVQLSCTVIESQTECENQIDCYFYSGKCKDTSPCQYYSQSRCRNSSQFCYWDISASECKRITKCSEANCSSPTRYYYNDQFFFCQSGSAGCVDMPLTQLTKAQCFSSITRYNYHWQNGACTPCLGSTEEELNGSFSTISLTISGFLILTLNQL